MFYLSTVSDTRLYIVPTPIGNLEDITLRALRVLKECDLIVAEDTRTTGKLLKHFDIRKPMQSYHIFNEHHQVKQLVSQMQQGKVLALVSDAGTPAISDPGFLLVRAAIQADVALECLPGATAFVPALVKSGLPSDRFVFEGFLPHKKGRKTRLEALAAEERTIVLYESPHRLLRCLEELGTHLGHDRQAAVSREISKLYEETARGTLEELSAHFAHGNIKGEIAIVVAGRNARLSTEPTSGDA